MIGRIWCERIDQRVMWSRLILLNLNGLQSCCYCQCHGPPFSTLSFYPCHLAFLYYNITPPTASLSFIGTDVDIRTSGGYFIPSYWLYRVIPIITSHVLTLTPAQGLCPHAIKDDTIMIQSEKSKTISDSVRLGSVRYGYVSLGQIRLS